jgi:hypothetical protein
VAVVVVLTAGGLAAYLASAGTHKAPRHQPPALSARVLSARTVGVIDFGPDDDKDAFTNDPDDHPLQLQPSGAGLRFVVVTSAELAAGVPLWTANQMADGTVIFIYLPTGKCLTPASDGTSLMLSHCTLRLSQRWRAVHATTILGQPIAQYANASTGSCLTAPPPPLRSRDPANPGPATLALCGSSEDRTQEIAFWWSA